MTRKPSRARSPKAADAPSGDEESTTRLFGFGREPLTEDQKDLLRRHVINMSRGRFRKSGHFETTEEDVTKLFTEWLPKAREEAKAAGRPLRVLFWAHGGLVSEPQALDHVLHYHEGWLRVGVYPIYFVWETDLLTALKDFLPGQRGIKDLLGGIKDKVADGKDTALEVAIHASKAGVKVWDKMKAFAAASVDAEGAARFTAQRLGEFVRDAGEPVELYACGHSAGSIFHSFFLPVAGQAGAKFRELYLLAPAITVDDFAYRLSSEIGESKTVGRVTMFTMNDVAEQADDVIKIYSKSLLYFVSGACEPKRGTDILGMEVCLRRRPPMRVLFGLDAPSAKGSVVFSPNGQQAGGSASNSTSHGGFDSDASTLNSMARRMARDEGLLAFVPTRGAAEAKATAARKPETRDEGEALPLRISLRYGEIQKAEAEKGEDPITAFAAGHYTGVEPAGPEWALDKAVSEAHHRDVRDQDCIVTSLTRRGVFPAPLGSSYIVPFPDQRRVVIVGLGMVGTLGPAELAWAVQELCLNLSRMGITHLATVLIGSGNGNMPVGAALAAWVQGIRRAFRNGECFLRQITFVEFSAEKLLKMADQFPGILAKEGVLNHAEVWRPHLADRRRALEAELKRREQELKDFAKEEREKLKETAGQAKETQTKSQFTRIHIKSEVDGYVFSALTDQASVPNREIQVDPKLVDSVAVQLSQTGETAEQVHWGRTLEQILIPEDLRDEVFNSAAHLILTVDASTARIPWEMLPLPGRDGDDASGQGPDAFLGAARNYGLTRQFRTVFAPAPQPVIHRKGKLRALVIADPAADAQLEGARREGEEVAASLERVGVEVVLLLGEQATRAAVARALITEPFDILHFAGHCFFDRENHGRSGWIFQANPLECFTAQELGRLKRVPPFVFSNACESGVTPDRQRDGGLPAAPAFAEAFFEKGVRNFIATGWPVGDSAAVAFALTFYELALRPSPRENLGEAVRQARVKAMERDRATWGAYQHYGNPSYQFPDPQAAAIQGTRPRDRSARGRGRHA